MYRTPAEDSPEQEEAIRLPLESRSIWMAIALVGGVALALGSGLTVLRWQLVQATEAQPPLRISTRLVARGPARPAAAPVPGPHDVQEEVPRRRPPGGAPRGAEPR